MKKTYKINFEMKLDGGGNTAGSWDIKAWTPGDALREVADLLRKTAKDEKVKKLTSLSVAVSEKRS